MPASIACSTATPSRLWSTSISTASRIAASSSGRCSMWSSGLPTPESDRAAFATVASVRVEDRASWDGRVFLTFDIDWAHDGVIHAAADMVEEADVAATWFVTHDTPALERLRANPRFEL